MNVSHDLKNIYPSAFSTDLEKCLRSKMERGWFADQHSLPSETRESSKTFLFLPDPA